MMSAPDSQGVRGRFLLAGLLAASAVLLLLLNLASEKSNQRRRATADRSGAVVTSIDGVVDSLLEEFHVDPRTVRSRPIRSQGKEQIREELHVTVPPGFVSLEFNRTLGRVMEQYGVHVIATERSHEGKVLLHIMFRGVIVRTLVLTSEP
jgi:hypothetical protein